MLRLRVVAAMAATLFVSVARSETGVVVDTDGKPLAEAMVDPGNALFSVLTDANGHFETKGSGPLVVRKQGFQSQLITEATPRPVRIELVKTENGIAPRCSEQGDYWSVGQRGLKFPKIAGIAATDVLNDVDYFARYYSVQIAKESGRILHGTGASWSWGTPTFTYLKDTVLYQERVFFDGPVMLVDARGETSDGKHWRYVGMFGESAAYYEAAPEIAAALDRVLDGLCSSR